MIKVSAPGKVHLIGEHAVVYNHPAIIAAVGKRVYAEAEKASNVILTDIRFKKNFIFTIHEVEEARKKSQEIWNICKEKGSFSELLKWVKEGEYENYWKATLGTILHMVGADSGIAIHITKCDIPTGSGLGSSAAQVVAISKAASELYGSDSSFEKVNEMAFECEKFAHGTPSGGDNTACCYGGLVWFQKSQPKNIVIPLGDEISHKLENFVLVYTKQPEKTTGELVQMVREIPEDERNPKMEELGKLTYTMKDVLKHKDHKKMKDIINRTNAILSSLGLAIPETDHIYQEVKNLGGAAKMCGACYGGVMLCWHESPQEIVDAIKKIGFQPFEADLAVEGVRIEKPF
ncbi:MAG: mevalonate kinase [Candidatus Aenigmarchaeota archaeon]|nr:mevalonate kinase [Candidatus Aenigmarchaeota archaeon]